MNSTLKTLQAEGRCFLDEPLARHTTWGVGGPAKIFVLPKALDQLVDVVAFCEEEQMKFKILGAGSNMLFSDNGYDGIVICTKAMEHDLAVFGNTITVGAGERLAKLAQTALENGLSGLEWACGIPGTVGGAIVQNAGAFGKDIASVFSKALVFSERKLGTKTNLDCEFSYRNSCFKKNKTLILDACFSLRPDNPEEIRKRMKLFASKRVATQPVGRSAGSVFLTCNGFSAGYLIEQAGLKGRQIGGAKISEKHANFFLNTGGASAGDILALIDEARQRVFEMFGVWIETEVEIVEEDNESF